MAKIVKNNFLNFLVICLIFVLITAWIFSAKPIEKAKASPDQETRRPDADGHTTNWSIYDSTHSGAAGDNSDSTWVYSSTDDVYEFLNVQDPTFADGTTVNWIQTYYRCQCSGTCDKGGEKIDMYISDGTTDTQTDANKAVSRTGFADLAGTQQTVNPVDGQAWEYTDIVNLQIGMMTDTTGGDEIQCADIWVVVDYTPISNQAPTVDTVGISPSPIDLVADGQKTVTISATITDNDGCEDVFTNGSITAVFYDADAVADSCSADDNNCYPSITLTEVGNTCDGASDYTGDASATVDVWFHANAGSNWTAKVTATDQASDSGSNTSTVTINTLIALKLDTSSINYQSVNPNNVSTQQTVIITTTGNTAVDVNLSGTDMTWSGNTIDVGQQKYSSTNGFDWDTAGTALTGSAVRHELSTAKPTANPSNQSESVYWKLKVPLNTPAGTPYGGTNTFEVVAD